ncbi:MAG: NYN domain-containing protein [Candidatus Melainabacteria bacterium]|nr:NYN domain-containing protein [Candidatus Melainabacteria bacterium]
MAAFVDGFNCYHRLEDHLRETGKNLKWLNYAQLLQRVCTENAQLVQLIRQSEASVYYRVHFFTAIPEWRGPEAVDRHARYLSALDSMGVQVHKGRFSSDRKEKESDVHLAIQLYRSAALNLADVIVLFSADTDFVPALRQVREDFPKKHLVLVTFKMKQVQGYASLQSQAHQHIRIRLDLMAQCQLPQTIVYEGKTIESPYRLGG